MTNGMGSKMAIVVIAIITVETVVGTQPDYSWCILGNGIDSLSTIQGGVDETLRMERYGYKKHSYRHAYSR